MILMIEELNNLKRYKIETLYLAVSLADKCLLYLVAKNKKPPCLIKLAATCTLIAAKLEEPMSPSINRMIKSM